MLVTFDKLDEISTGLVRYYSIKIGFQEFTEFEMFDNKDFPLHIKENQFIVNVINEMQNRGAKSYYFVNEASAEYLPKVSQAIKEANKEDYGLRLYCKRLRDDIVVLFNGDIKTKNNPIDCDNVKLHFLRAIKIGLLLDKAIFNKDIDLDEQDPFEDFELDI